MQENRIFKAIKVNEAKLTDGFWGKRVDNYMDIIYNQEKILLAEDNAARLLNFGIAAGEIEGEFYRNAWSDGDCYKFLEACANQYSATKDSRITDVINKYIPWIEKSQEEDGYICTQCTLKSMEMVFVDNGDQPKQIERWAKPMNHELYNFGHLFTAGVALSDLVGDDRLLEVAKRAADYLYTVFVPLKPEMGDFGFNPSQIMGLVDLYRKTGKEEYLELADVFVTMRGTKIGTGDQNQNRVALRDEVKPVGHAVTAAYLYAGAADVYAHTNEEALITALERIWEDMIDKRIYITGGVCPLYDGISERGDMVHEAFSDEYNLPHRISYNETCANIAVAMWAQRMLDITGKATYGDWMEQILFNAGISGASLDMKRYFYANPLAHRADKHIVPDFRCYSHVPNERFSTFDCWCCPPQLWRTFTGLPKWLYSTNDKGVSINMFAGSKLDTTLADGSAVKINVVTNYPWDETVEIAIEECPKDMELSFRIPAWCSNATCNGEQITAGIHSTKVNVGEKVVIELPMTASLYTANPMVEQANGMIAVQRGPVVYCLESLDIQGDYSIDELALPIDAKFTEVVMKDLMYDMIGLETQMVYRPKGDTLYYKLLPDTDKKVNVRLIPYFAWANRKESDMSVWLQKA